MTDISDLPSAEFARRRDEVVVMLSTRQLKKPKGFVSNNMVDPLCQDAAAIIQRQQSALAEATRRYNEAVVQMEAMRAALEAARPHTYCMSRVRAQIDAALGKDST